jgi:hypothetical protein
VRSVGSLLPLSRIARSNGNTDSRGRINQSNSWGDFATSDDSMGSPLPLSLKQRIEELKRQNAERSDRMKEGRSLYRSGRDQGDQCSQEYRAKISVDRAKVKPPTLSEPFGLGDKAQDMDRETSPQDMRAGMSRPESSKALSLDGLRTSLQSSASRDVGHDFQPGSIRSRFMIARDEMARDRSPERKRSVSQMTGHSSQSESIHRYSCTDQTRSDSQMTSCYPPSESMCGYSCKTHGEGTKLPSLTLVRRSQALLPLQRNHVPPSLSGHTQERARPVRHPVTHSHTF